MSDDDALPPLDDTGTTGARPREPDREGPEREGPDREGPAREATDTDEPEADVRVAQQRALLEESELRSLDRNAAPGTVVEHRRSEDTVEPVD